MWISLVIVTWALAIFAYSKTLFMCLCPYTSSCLSSYSVITSETLCPYWSHCLPNNHKQLCPYWSHCLLTNPNYIMATVFTNAPIVVIAFTLIDFACNLFYFILLLYIQLYSTAVNAAYNAAAISSPVIAMLFSSHCHSPVIYQ